MSKFFAAKNLAMSASTCAFPVIGSSVIGSRVCAFATGAGVAADVFAAGVGAAAPAAASAASAASLLHLTRRHLCHNQPWIIAGQH